MQSSIGIFELIYSILAGIVQGITEWLPISSTGHLILLDSLFNVDLRAEFVEMFDVVIQFGSIMAIVVLYFGRLNPFAPSKSASDKKKTWSLWGKILIAAVPAGIIGVLFDDLLSATVFSEPGRKFVVAGALFVYGILFIIIERKNKDKKYRIDDPESIDCKTALGIGAFQVLALIPGTSRSGSTIIGSTVLGVSRKAAAEFSFFLAIPVMLGASLLKIAKFVAEAGGGIASAFTGGELAVLAIGTVVSFLVSLVAVKFLVEFVRRHSFEVFGTVSSFPSWWYSTSLW